MSNETSLPRTNRRHFLAALGASAGAGAAMLAPHQLAQAADMPKAAGSETYDVVIVGSGLAASTAALQARLDGANVIMLEKMPERRAGGNSRISGGSFLLPGANTPEGKAKFVSDNIKKAQGRGNHELYKVYAEHIFEDIAWLESMGIQFEPFLPTEPFSVGIRMASPKQFQGMPRVLSGINKEYRAKGGKIVFETKAKKLIVNEQGKVVGVRAATASGLKDFMGGAVILATGGYAGNKQLLEQFVDPAAGGLMVRGRPWLTGDGLLMAQEIGAGAMAMGGLTSLHMAAVSPKDPAAGNPSRSLSMCLGINRDGQRFVDESKGYVAFGKTAVKQPGQTVALVFDDKTIAAKPRFFNITMDLFKRQGIGVVEAGSIEELAQKIEVPPAALAKTIKEFNAAVNGEQALTANPPKASLATKLEGPKFYAFAPLTPGVTMTFGGMMINASAQVLETDGRPIPGLFAAGEISGHAYYDDYFAGGSLDNCLVMGRIAGSAATKAAKSA